MATAPETTQINNGIQSQKTLPPKLSDAINIVEKVLMEVRPLVDEEEFEFNVKPLAEQLIAAIITAYLNKEYGNYEVLGGE